MKGATTELVGQIAEDCGRPVACENFDADDPADFVDEQVVHFLSLLNDEQKRIFESILDSLISDCSSCIDAHVASHSASASTPGATHSEYPRSADTVMAIPGITARHSVFVTGQRDRNVRTEPEGVSEGVRCAVTRGVETTHSFTTSSFEPDGTHHQRPPIDDGRRTVGRSSSCNRLQTAERYRQPVSYDHHTPNDLPANARMHDNSNDAATIEELLTVENNMPNIAGWSAFTPRGVLGQQHDNYCRQSRRDAVCEQDVCMSQPQNSDTIIISVTGLAEPYLRGVSSERIGTHRQQRFANTVNLDDREQFDENGIPSDLAGLDLDELLMFEHYVDEHHNEASDVTGIRASSFATSGDAAASGRQLGYCSASPLNVSIRKAQPR